VLLGETFRGNRQRHFLFDLFLSKRARGNAPSLEHINKAAAPCRLHQLSGIEAVWPGQFTGPVHESPTGQPNNFLKYQSEILQATGKGGRILLKNSC